MKKEIFKSVQKVQGAAIVKSKGNVVIIAQRCSLNYKHLSKRGLRF